MTFLEAAIEVLRSADGPLHFSEIAERAVSENLLSHVGRDPEAAMQSCLNSAVRSGRTSGDVTIIRAKPGHYTVDGAAKTTKPAKAKTKSKAKPKTAEETGATESAPAKKKRTKKAAAKSEKKASEAAEAPETTGEADVAQDAANEGDPPAAPAPELEFEAPEGSGLEGVQDVALVMANAMSRLVDERPELRDELEAAQRREREAAEAEAAAASESDSRTRRRERSNGARREPIVQTKPRAVRDRDDDRGGRKRRRRRRRGRRVDWSDGDNVSGGNARISVLDRLLDGAAKVLEQAGARSLHVRQIAEQLSNEGLLGGEVSEIERAVTGAILSDLHEHGGGSRFCARGDARYQLRGTRLPTALAKAEEAFRSAAVTLEREMTQQLPQWLQTLGVRGLDAFARLWLQAEGYTIASTTAPARGLGRLVVEDPEAEEEGAKCLVVLVPKRTELDQRLWDSEVDRGGAPGLIVVAVGEVAEEVLPEDARVVHAEELAEWMLSAGLGTTELTRTVRVFDPAFLESIGGLDT